MKEKKLAVVTGGGKGIGRAISETLLEQGCEVVFMDINDAAAAEFLAARGGAALHYRHCDVADPQAIGAACEETAAAYGTVSILINNAGIQTHVPFLEMTPQLWQQTLDVDLNSAFYFCRALAPGMAAQQWGRIVNISSMSARRGSRLHVHYCAAKAGLLGLTRGLSIELAPSGVTVNAVCPGIVDTDIVQHTLASKRETWLGEMHVKRLGQPADIANAVAFLVSERSDWISGQALDINGGILTP